MKENRKVTFSSDKTGQRTHAGPDERLPVKNMKDWGCTDSVIKAPQYADRSYQLCCNVGQEEFSKIVGQVQNVRPPTMLAKQREHKDAFQTVNRRKSTAGYLQADWNAGESPSRPFTVGRAKERKK